jgi:hypothetical protein
MTQSHLPGTGRGVTEAVIKMCNLTSSQTCLFELRAGFLFLSISIECSKFCGWTCIYISQTIGGTEHVVID